MFLFCEQKLKSGTFFEIANNFLKKCNLKKWNKIENMITFKIYKQSFRKTDIFQIYEQFFQHTYIFWNSAIFIKLRTNFESKNIFCKCEQISKLEYFLKFLNSEQNGKANIFWKFEVLNFFDFSNISWKKQTIFEIIIFLEFLNKIGKQEYFLKLWTTLRNANIYLIYVHLLKKNHKLEKK